MPGRSADGPDRRSRHEIHEGGLTFAWLAEKWGVSLATLGELIADHCRRLEKLPRVDHAYRPD